MGHLKKRRLYADFSVVNSAWNSATCMIGEDTLKRELYFENTLAHRLCKSTPIQVARRVGCEQTVAAFISSSIIISADELGRIMVHDMSRDGDEMCTLDTTQVYHDIFVQGDKVYFLHSSGSLREYSMLKLEFESGINFDGLVSYSDVHGDMFKTGKSITSRKIWDSSKSQLKIHDTRSPKHSLIIHPPETIGSLKFGACDHQFLVSLKNSTIFGIVDQRKASTSDFFAATFDACATPKTFWNEYTGSIDRSFIQHSAPPYSVQLLSGRRVLSSTSGEHKIWSLDSTKGITTLKEGPFHSSSNNRVIPAVAGNNTFYSSDGLHICRWGCETTEPINVIQMDARVSCLDVNRFGTGLVACKKDGKFLYWDSKSS